VALDDILDLLAQARAGLPVFPRQVKDVTDPNDLTGARIS